MLPKALGRLELAVVVATIVAAPRFTIGDLSPGYLTGSRTEPARRRLHFGLLPAAGSAFPVATEHVKP